MGNAWTNRRGRIPRPQVCHPPPPPLGGPSPLTCEFTPPEVTLTEFETNGSDFHAGNDNCSDFDQFALIVVNPNPNFTGGSTVDNKGLTFFTYLAMDGPGDFTFAVQVTDCEGNICIASVTFHVTPFDTGPPP